MQPVVQLLLAGLCFFSTLCGSVALGEANGSPTDSAAQKTYRLRYQFRPNETIRWEVLQQSRVKTTVSGTTQVAEMVTRSTKAWRVKQIGDDGTVTFEHLVENVDMWQKFTGRQEVRYNSASGEQPPPGFEAIAESINVPLAEVTIDTRGTILRRQRKPARASVESDTLLIFPFPEEAIAAGHVWSDPYEFQLPMEDGTVRAIQAVHQFKLVAVEHDVATIEVATKILTPVNNPALEAKLLQREQSGTLRFDVEAGRLLDQQMDLDRRVVGFSGAASSIHLVSRVTEKLIEKESTTATAARPKPAESSSK